MKEKINAYYQLTKPGVLYGNVITAVAGYFFGAQGHFDLILFIAILLGSTFVIASACVLNNYLDQDIDAKMTRTKKRPLIQGAISGRGAVIFCIVLVIAGLFVLYVYTNLLTTLLGILGFIVYVVLYGMLSKRLSIHGTLVGSISGAIPILMGYTATTNRIDAGALFVFAVLFFWQLPEFYSISIYRLKEYKAAHIPVMSVIRGVRSTTIQIFIYTLLCVIASLLMTFYAGASYSYFFVMLLVGIYWIWLGSKGLTTKDADAWSRKMFHTSLIFLLVFCFMISIENLLP